MNSSFVIPCLEEVVITLTPRQTSNAKKMTRMIKSLLKYGNMLKKININVRTHKMDDVANDFSKEIRRFRYNSMFFIPFVTIYLNC